MATRTEERHTIVLPDGRRLSYGVWGCAGGPPVFLMHGWPGCRLLGLQFAESARATGVLLIVPDRPGIGGSDPLQGRTLLDWPSDIEMLADSLGVDRIVVAGYSGGAPYALACAYSLKGRVTGVAVISGLGPLDSAGAMACMPPHLRAIFSLCRTVPHAARVPAALMAMGAQRFPRLTAYQTMLASPASDRAVLARGRVLENMRREYREAFRQGVRHVAYEVSLFAAPWGFPLNGLPAGVRIYHGEADRFVPARLARRLSAAIPGCRPRFLPAAGHFWIIDHFGEVLEDLMTS